MFGVAAGTDPAHRVLHIQPTRDQASRYARDPSLIVPVQVVEDPEGPLTGWMKPDATEPVLIERNLQFPRQFPNGVIFAESSGHGRRVRLRVEPVAASI
jgi:hypothetical protein